MLPLVAAGAMLLGGCYCADPYAYSPAAAVPLELVAHAEGEARSQSHWRPAVLSTVQAVTTGIANT